MTRRSAYLLFALILITLVYSFSLVREWQFFDERMFYEEGLFPIASSFSDLLELISTYAFSYHSDSQNTFFSNIVNYRYTNILGAILNMTILFLFKKNSLLYHLLELFVHLINASLVFLILSRLFRIFGVTWGSCKLSYDPKAARSANVICKRSEAEEQKHLHTNSNFNKETAFATAPLACFFTLIWALHPQNVEAVLLVTNWTNLLSYSIGLYLTLFLVSKANAREKLLKGFQALSIGLLYFLSLLLSEYNYTLPLVLFFLLTAILQKTQRENVIKNAIWLTIPLFIGLICFLGIYVLLNFQALSSYSNNSITLFLERTFWLAPQILLHFFKLFFLLSPPSINQSNWVQLSSEYITPYSIFAISLFLLIILLPLFVGFVGCRIREIYPKAARSANVICERSEAEEQKHLHTNSNFNEKTSFATTSLITVYSFLFSILPFLQIISPTYALVSDRYCYFPLIFFVILLITAFAKLISKIKKPVLISIPIFLAVIFLGTKSILRINDWKSTYTLYTSDLKHTNNNLYTGQIYSILAYHFSSIGNIQEMNKYSRLAVENLQKILLAHMLEELTSKKEKNEPKILKFYGLDSSSLVLRAAFATSDIRFNFLEEDPNTVLRFYEPFIKNKLENAGAAQLVIYAKLLNSAGNKNKAVEILENAKKRYPFSPSLLFTLSNLYMEQENFDKAKEVIQEGYNFYPSHPRMLLRMVKLAEIKNDENELAKYEYLIGLRTHSEKGYQRALQLFLKQNKVNEAKKTLAKLLKINDKDPTTLLLLTKYYEKTRQKEKILPTLYGAYNFAKQHYLENKIDPHIYESILLSIVSFNVEAGDLMSAKKYIDELEEMPNILEQNKAYINNIKQRFNLG